MRTLIHLSDLHFGAVDESLIAPLREKILTLAPDLIVVSGDLTQRAQIAQFEQARQFLDTLPTPQIIVPGNHDIPLHNIARRFLRPLDRYKRYITSDLEPSYVDSEIAIVGLNSARSATIKRGRINAGQILRARERLEHASPQAIRIVVSHHPFDALDAVGTDIVGRAHLAMQTFAACGVDVLLSGHLHAATTIETASRYRIQGFAAIVVQAGTATSIRRRGENNSFNVLRIERTRISVQPHAWIPVAGEYQASSETLFSHSGDGWSQLSG
ncbi:MAG: metallophosphoesterase [Lysobacteraceae bacterium]